jgi:hypothetical protein
MAESSESSESGEKIKNGESIAHLGNGESIEPIENVEADLARVSRLIDDVVRGARIPLRRSREELRAELWSHFEERARTPGGLVAAMAGFGDPAALAQGFRHVYTRDYRLAYLLKLAASLVASALAALLVQVAANLRVGRSLDGGSPWSLGPGFPKSALISIGVALGAVAAWEALRRPLALRRGLLAISLYVLAALAVQLAFGYGAQAFVAAVMIVALGYATSRLETRPRGLLAAYLAFSIAIYGIHRAAAAGGMGLAAALAVSAAFLAVWAASLAIVSRADRAFHGLVGHS